MVEFFTIMFGVVLAQISPGPNLVAVASVSLSSGRTAGLCTVLGVASAIFFWASLFAFGVGALLISFPETITVMRIAGGTYLLYMGIRAFKAAFGTQGISTIKASNTIDNVSAFRKGLLVNLTNPKTAMMWVAIAMYLGASGTSSFKLFLFGIAVSATATVIYSTYAYLFSTHTASSSYRRFYTVIEGVFGCVFGFVGGKLLLQGINDLR